MASCISKGKCRDDWSGISKSKHRVICGNSIGKSKRRNDWSGISKSKHSYLVIGLVVQINR